MDDLWTRMAAAVLAVFGSFVAMLPVACGGLMLYSEHVYGDVDARGPASMLGGLAIAGVMGVLVTALVLLKTRRR
jgi:hypothetical protein